MERRQSFEKDVYSASSDSEAERGGFDAQKAKKNENEAKGINRKRNAIMVEMGKLEEKAVPLYRAKEILEEASQVFLYDLNYLQNERDDADHEALLNQRISEIEIHNNLLEEHNREVAEYNSNIDNLDIKITKFNQDAHNHNKQRGLGITRVNRIEEHPAQIDESELLDHPALWGE